jgi:tetratricopeptide (TPR) repeat protein
MDTIDEVRDALGERFYVEREIGHGGMATVYLARELHPPRQVAIKVFESILGDSVGRKRFLREIEIAARLRHPNVVPIYSAGEVAGLLYFVMPYVEGETVRVRLTRSGALTLPNALQVAHDVATALAHAHEQGVIHRDIKPENILLSRRHAMVADFGIAKAISSGAEVLTRTGFSLGTPRYMSPEQARGLVVDGRSDIYALGRVLFEMVFLNVPTDPEGLAPEDRALLKNLPRPAADVLRRSLATEPEGRFPTAASFAEALLEARQAGGRVASVAARRRERAWKFLAVLALVALVGFVVLRLLSPPPGGREGVVAEAIAGNNPDTLVALGRSSIARGEWDLGWEALARAAEMDSRDGLLALDVGMTSLWMRRYPEAERWLRRAALNLDSPAPAVFALAWVDLARRGEMSAPASARFRDERFLASPWATLSDVRTAYLSFRLAPWLDDDLLANLAASPGAAVDRPDLTPVFQMIFGAVRADRRGDSTASRQRREDALVLLERARDVAPVDPLPHALASQILADLGRRDAALNEARRATELKPIGDSALEGSLWEENLMRALLATGRTGEGLRIVERLASQPSLLGPGLLETDQVFKEVADEPRFRAVLEGMRAGVSR